MTIGEHREVDVLLRAAPLACVALVMLTSLRAAAVEGPTIEHQPLTTASHGQPVTLRANITSNTRFAVATPTAYVHVSGTPRFTKFAMALVAGTTDLYQVTLPSDLLNGDFDYYLEAFDMDDNGPGRQGDEQHPLHVKLGATDGRQIPPAAASPETRPTAPPAVNPPAAAPPDLRSVPSLESPPGGLVTTAVASKEADHTLSFALMGVGGACLIAAGVLMVTSLTARSSYLSTPSLTAAAGDKNASEAEAGVAWGALGLGLTSLGVGGYLLVDKGTASVGRGSP